MTATAPSRRLLLNTGIVALGAGASVLLLGAESASAASYDLGPSTLKKGSRGAYVKNLQRALNDKNRAGLKIDGIFGAGVHSAVVAFQKKAKLSADGKVGPATKKALIGATAAVAAPKAPVAPKAPAAPKRAAPVSYHRPVATITPVRGGVPLKLGWNGTRVRIIQKKLGIARSGASQTYDAATRKAVIAFQKKKGLVADGTVGAKTWALLAPEYPFDMDAWTTPVRLPLSATPQQRIEEMIRFTKANLGRPYTWGGAGWKDPSVAGFDCSGLLLQAMYSAGLDPQPVNVLKHAEPTYRTTQALYGDARLRSFPIAQRKRGDLIFYGDSQGIVRHMTLYIGDGRMYESWNGSKGTLNYASTIHGIRYVKPLLKRPFA